MLSVKERRGMKGSLSWTRLLYRAGIVGLIMLSGACSRKAPQSRVQRISPSIENLDLAGRGPYEVAKNLYGTNEKVAEFQPAVDPKVYGGGATDLRGIIYTPSPNNHSDLKDGAYPLVVLLHGNHGTCGQPTAGDEPRDDSGSQFTTDGACERDGYTVEVPSYLGYSYLAEHLASHGFIVVSINANRGITGVADGPINDKFLIEARGRLVLKHLAWLRQWHDGKRNSAEDVGLDLKGKIDFNHVGLMGHSRGGEGMRAAYEFYANQDAKSYAADVGPMKIEGILEFAPVDLMASQTFDALPVNWVVVIPSCDGDITDFIGTGPFRRRRLSASDDLGFSGVFVVPGANHNYFNSEWQSSDAAGCSSGVQPLWSDKDRRGSEVQRRLGSMVFSAFMRGFVGQAPDAMNFRRVFDPQYKEPKELSAFIEPMRETLQRDTASIFTAVGASGGGGVTIKDLKESYTPGWVEPIFASRTRHLTQVSWSSPAPGAYYQADLWEQPQDLSSQWILSVNLARLDICQEGLDGTNCQEAPEKFTNVGIALVMGDGSFSKTVSLKDYASLGRGVNRMYAPRPCRAPFVDPSEEASQCTAPAVKDAAGCDEVGGLWNGSACSYVRSMRYMKSYVLFQEVPIELKDFEAKSIKSVKGIRFVMDASPGATLMVDQTFILRSRDKR